MAYEMEAKRLVILSVLLPIFLHVSYGCQVDDHLQWSLPIQQTIEDVFEGVVIRRSTTDIEAVNDVAYGQATIGGPYFDVVIEDSHLVVRTNDAFKGYEEIETASRVSITVEFRCTGGSLRNGLIIWIDIDDTNNNAPRFIPDEFEFIVTPPLPPGFLVTGCNNEITVRDIDLTTKRIDFTIEENPYFEIEYDEESSTEPKEFKAQLRTKTFVRSLSEPITLTITATDVDETNDPPLSNSTTVRLVADTEFQFPEEPVFSQTFYLANYTEDHQLNLLETISLEWGFDEYVNFTLEGEYAEDHFDLITDENRATIVVVSPLPVEIWSERQIFLVVKAEREFTSGASATVIVQLPEEVTLQFERAHYEGIIINNGLQLSPLVLGQGFEGVTVSADVVGEWSTYFLAEVQGQLVNLTMLPLTDDIINNNSFISVQVVASSDRSSTITIVNLEIIKDDNVTPVFDKLVYNGTYDSVIGLTAEQITFVQGFDDTVTVDLIGEHADYFGFNPNGPVLTLTSSTIPPEIFSQQNILISIEAKKPRTVGANAAIHISLPAARELEFEESTYRGTIEGNNLLSLQTITLHRGYEEGVDFSLSGEHATYFIATNVQNQVSIEVSPDLPASVITQNNVITLTLTASDLNAVPTSTSIILDIIKDDTTTPIFSQNIYYGIYSGSSIDIETINLAQGSGSDVSFRLDGADAQYFSINENNAVITLQLPIPEEVIFNEKVLLFNVIADKELTVGANAAVLIRFPAELTDSTIMRFSQNTYVGTLEENEIRLSNIVLDTGFAAGTDFNLFGDHAEHFRIVDTNNIVQILSLNTLPNEVVENDDIIVLEVEASRPRAVSVRTSVVIEIVKREVIAPVFSQAYYTGTYTEQTGLTFEETINLSEGYDETVKFALTGESATWFVLDGDLNSLSLALDSPVPIEVLQNNNQLLFTVIANNSYGISGRAVISIDLPKEIPDAAVILEFDRVSYLGSIENNQAIIPTITLSEGYTPGAVQFTLHGELVEYFSVSPQGPVAIVDLQSAIPEESIPANRIILLEIQATAPQTIPAYATIVLKYVVDENVSPVAELIFTQTFYSGSYAAATGLSFPTSISLSQGYTPGVTFDLEGDHAEWFDLEQQDNSATLVLTSPIPSGVLANNLQLVFVVTAQSPGSAIARATVVISLTDEFPEGSVILGFDRVSYLGSIENNQAIIPTITLSEGYTPGAVQFTLHGELVEYFSVSPQGPVAIVDLQRAIPEESIPANRIILLEIQATAPQTIPAYATIVLKYVVDENVSPVAELIFTQTFYSGSYAAATGLSFPTSISLSQGYTPGVIFDLEGDHAEWFDLEQQDNSATLVLTSPIPSGVLANNLQLVFVVTAQSPGSAIARATVVISLTDEFPEGSVILGFDRVSYLGSIENNQAIIPTITLSEGYNPGAVQFTLHGELVEYFSVSPQGPVAIVDLQRAIPEESIPANRIILLEIQATAPQTIPAYATIVLKYVVDENVSPVAELIFTQTFYSGSYAAATGLSFPTSISLSQGYTPGVTFDLEGDHAEWFDLEQQDNSATLVLTSPIPSGVLANNLQLVFVVTAQSPGSAIARATVVISLTDEFPEGSVILGFDRVSYLGSIENNQAIIPTITLSEGYTQGAVQFTLHGELVEYFSVSPQGPVAIVDLQSAIPEESLPANRIILLEIQATAPQTIPAYATIVLKYVVDENVSPVAELIFTQTFYSGSYAAATGLSFPTSISLSQGYSPGVTFDLEGDHAEWFDLEQQDNSATLVLTSPIPSGVLANNLQLVFVVTAQSPGSAIARATVVISLTDEFPEGSVILGFDRVSYLGSIENNQAIIPTITLSEGYTPGAVQFTLHGELVEYFSVSPQGPVAIVDLQSAIPEESIPANRIILLEIQATAPQTIPAYATIVLKYVVDENVSPVAELIFTQTFYSGSYAAATGLSFPTSISLSQGYTPGVTFDLEGDHAEWFDLEQQDNSATLVLTSPIPSGVLANNLQLVFVVTAQSPGSAIARATVVISLTDEFPEGSVILGFDRVSYLGSIENNQAIIPTITLSEGYTPGAVQFTLHGELVEYFSVSPQGPVAIVVLQRTIPEESIPANRIILLEIQATAPQTIPAYATIVLKYVVDENVSPVAELIFTQTFYSGSYAAATGLSFPTSISLSQGYTPGVTFDLEGDHAEWFDLEQQDNSATLVLTSPIPSGVLANNLQLVFVVTAQRPSSAIARATVVISLTDEFPEGSVILGFDRVSYLGSIENNQAIIPTITLSEGYTQGAVQFTLHGELVEYFSVSPQGPVAIVDLQRAIPEESIPANRIILLEIQATAPQTIPAYATIVLKYVVDENVSPVAELIFTQTFYSGSYAAATGLSFPTSISLSQGYTPGVTFDLEGDHAEWFDLEQQDNSATLVLTSPIPSGVLANNLQLVFVVTAQSPGSAIARATVVISLTDEFPEGSVILGFDRVSYLGSIENNQAIIPIITLSEGYTPGAVQFTLHGELVEYFSVSPQGPVVIVDLQRAIPEESIPANRVILLEIQATAPQTIPAYATIVLKYVVDENVSPVAELIFTQTFYSGSYAAATGLSFPTSISLSQGYTPGVTFDLEGDHAEWFDLEQQDNSATLVLTSPIPSGVLANNLQLVFVVTAQSPGSAIARATVVISLTDEFPEGSVILGFDRVSYLGSIENNQAIIPTITLSEGYTPGAVQFTLHGELVEYFSVSPQGPVAIVDLQRAIPEESIPANRVILLEIQATAPQTIPAYATIVLKYVVDENVSPVAELIFTQTFYSGSYATATGLSFPTSISLSQGYTPGVTFDLEGDHAEWFDLEQQDNSATLVLTSPIPSGVLANNLQLVFIVTAQSPGSAIARATVVISLTDEFPEGSVILGFDRVSYLGSIENNQAIIPTITLSEGYTQGAVQFTLHGELVEYFSVSPQGPVAIVDLQRAIPEESIPANRIILLEIQATAPQTIPAYATIVLKYVVDENVSPVAELIFTQTFYSGSYAAATGLSFPTSISLSQGYTPGVTFDLEGDHAEWFDLEQQDNSATLVLTSPIPSGVLANNLQLVFVVTAQSPGSAIARATVVISLTDEFPEGSVILGFDRVSYLGSIENNQAIIPTITLSEGYTPGAVQFTLHGELVEYFSVSPQGPVAIVDLQRTIPEEFIPANLIILLEIQATAPQTIPAYATIVLKYVVNENVSPVAELIFTQTFYSGSYAAATGLSFPTSISLSQGYTPGVTFDLEGDHAEWFDLEQQDNSATLVLTSPIPSGVLANNLQLVFVVTAQSPGSAIARATVVISLTDEFPEGSVILGFDRVSYLGSIENNQAIIPTITLSEGYTPGAVQFTLHGELVEYFSVSPQGPVAIVDLQRAIPEESIPANRVILLEIQATAPQTIPAYATIVLKYVVDENVSPVAELIFTQTFYSGSYATATGLSFPTSISLSQGYTPGVTFDLEGDHAEWFDLEQQDNSATLVLTSPIPSGVLANNLQLVFVVTAQSPGSAIARATVVISLIEESQPGPDVSFEKVIFGGIIQNGIVHHETITVTGFSGSNIELHGEYSALFESDLSSNGIVTVTTSGSITMPINVNQVVLELRAGTASAVLVLNVINTDLPPVPTVTFSSPSYAIRVDITHTGLIGQVQATADNGEAVRYSLLLDNVHLQERLSIIDGGELYLSAPLNSGAYTFSVIATTVFTQIQGTASVFLSVETITVCGNEYVIPPLIVLDVDEEEPHYDLINGTRYDNCHFTLTNRWPVDHTWLYVDERGLHTTSIDREHESIAFMPVSQVQVEIILHCEGDSTRFKRSLSSDALGPYDYGTNKWILTDTILYNSRRSFVNVIVNDINDNAPIFVGKENEPIVVGYPVPNLAERVLPRSLTELQATDADIGENAALVYWSAEPQLAVAPSTGFVHLRNGAELEDGQRLTVNAIDRNGHADGLTGSIDILVRLLDENYIAVVTVQNAFLDDEQTVLLHISEAVGYEVRVLRSVVISIEDATRRKRDVSNATGASLQMYVYGLVQREPVSVEQLTEDISTTIIGPVIIASTVSLQDHLEGQEMCDAGRDTGLLVATIILSVLLFIVLVLIAVWFFLRWKKNRNYDEFSDENSLASRNESVNTLPKPEVLPKPRLDISELKKSERRLQEMLDAPVEEISVQPVSSRNDAILDMPTPEPITPIVIQSIDKLKDAADESSEDEFGEIVAPKRKSVVTFNENVEKIIHVEDTPDSEDLNADPDYEVYKL